MLELRSGKYCAIVDPKRGGSLAALDWEDIPILRASRPGSMLDTACFPLVPFSNRIARGAFQFGGRAYKLAPNAPQVDPRNPLHGYGWLSEWQVIEAEGNSAIIEHVHAKGAWPWSYRARQHFTLDDTGLSTQLEVRNLDKKPMPAGLGFHPYFPRNADTVYLGQHRSEWQVDEECLPVSLIQSDRPRDWWEGKPAGARCVDTAYMSRKGALSIKWPDKGIGARVSPSDNLSVTVVYIPESKEFFCVEPVSHETNAINHLGSGMAILQVGETLQAAMRIEVFPINALV